MATPKIIADFSTQISSAISIGSTSFTLLSVTDDDGVAAPDGLYYFTIDAGSSNKEYLTGTLTSATKTVASVKTVSRQGAETSGAARAHRVGSAIKITDFATYKNYIDEVSLAGVSNATTTLQGAVEIATQAEVDAGTATGGTGASVVATPATTRAHLYHDYVADAGSTDAYAITVVPAITAYTAGQEFTFKANTANTGACTLNVCALGAKTLKKTYNSDLITGDILASQIVSVVYDGTNMQLKSPVISSAPTIQTFTSSGTWTKPSGLKYVEVEVQAPGGGGGGTSSTDDAAGGGGAGGYSRKLILAASLGSTETVTVGLAGTQGPGTGGSGGNGGNVSFGSHLSATGGSGGSNSAGDAGGSGGYGSGGDLNIGGGDGYNSDRADTSDDKGGNGGSAVLGGGGRGDEGNNGGGATGKNYGGGGGGGASNSGGDSSGGAGGDGIVIVKEFYN